MKQFSLSNEQEILDELKIAERDHNMKFGAVMCIIIIIIFTPLSILTFIDGSNIKLDLLTNIIISLVVVIPIIICSVIIYLKRDSGKNFKLVIKKLFDSGMGIYIPTRYQRNKFGLLGMVLPFERIKTIYFNDGRGIWTVRAVNNEATTISNFFLPNQDIFVSKYRDQIEFATDRCYFWYDKIGSAGVFYILYDAIFDENGVRLVFQKHTQYLHWGDITKIRGIIWKSMNMGSILYLKDEKVLGIIELTSSKKKGLIADIDRNWKKAKKIMKERGEL